MAVLVTGAAGFIGFHVARALLSRGEAVIGVDDLNAYYPPELKRARLDILRCERNFTFVRLDIAEAAALKELVLANGVTHILHLAAQAGVRHSVEAPFDYVHSNLVGHASVLEAARALPDLQHLVYASSSSVYGGNAKTPFSEADRVDTPISLYAATKRADELMSHAYAELYGISQTGLRFFTVYGPWGRPDMAYWKFAEAMIRGEPIDVYNGGEMWRDFTYIDDAVRGVLAVLDGPPGANDGKAPHRIYNIGNNRPVLLNRMIGILEDCLGMQAIRRDRPVPPGDVLSTSADIDALIRDYGYEPRITLEEGLPRFVEWYLEAYGEREQRRASAAGE
ncbi:MAG: NAD-dependent epimerase/dehydratase family protein [Alphaproteobacteria bacterium]